ncbi:hypothetical protein NDK47_25735 [Brevibacillus ruminantium]|uniref:Uncharacterized protein n=1 Tax=Brevibacillus ruminantium TaxID=2950604 RepID=A0ABY4WE76_9BACL|nr:hypothetical protein [Brevibacillus ruminantium]USG65466.1 hypothetical protein NDK47_25735 [Brevibacillus ruminantium]
MNRDTHTQNEHDHFVRHGGVHFRSLVSPQEINRFIGRLPAGKRESLFEVLDELEKAGKISLYNDQLFTDGNGVVGGGDPGSEPGSNAGGEADQEHPSIH